MKKLGFNNKWSDDWPSSTSKILFSYARCNLYSILRSIFYHPNIVITLTLFQLLKQDIWWWRERVDSAQFDHSHTNLHRSPVEENDELHHVSASSSLSLVPPPSRQLFDQAASSSRVVVGENTSAAPRR
jgi:hypothetical protein